MTAAGSPAGDLLDLLAAAAAAVDDVRHLLDGSGRSTAADDAAGTIEVVRLAVHSASEG